MLYLPLAIQHLKMHPWFIHKQNVRKTWIYRQSTQRFNWQTIVTFSQISNSSTNDGGTWLHSNRNEYGFPHSTYAQQYTTYQCRHITDGFTLHFDCLFFSTSTVLPLFWLACESSGSGNEITGHIRGCNVFCIDIVNSNVNVSTNTKLIIQKWYLLNTELHSIQTIMLEYEIPVSPCMNIQVCKEDWFYKKIKSKLISW